MSKYIRTKDDGRLFEVLKSDEENVCVTDYDYDNNDYYTRTIKLCDVRQADAVEELCDMFVIVSKANPLIKNFTVHIESAKSYGTEDDDIYGAIWAEGDKGEPILMSVAKMNEEGDLKLL